MKKILITGRPGTGKSTVAAALAAHGYNSFDLEEVPGIVRLELQTTGEPAEWPTGYVDWSVYAWNLQAEPLKSFLNAHNDTDLYVAVSASNQADYYDLFDIVFVLTLDSPEALRYRLEHRDVHEFNQGPENIQKAVENYTVKTAQIIEDGCIPLDNTMPLDSVINTLVAKVNEG